jgi:putative ABC transport system permease protein
VIIDDAVAALAFHGESAVGKRLFLRITTPEPEWYDVIGVVGHQRHASLAVPGPEAIFILNGHGGHEPPRGGRAHAAIRSSSGRPVRAAVAQIDPRAPLAEVQPMTAFVDKAMAPVRFTSTLIGIFAVVAVLLAAIGLYGSSRRSCVSARQRLACAWCLARSAAPFFRLIVGEGLRLSAAGIGLGLIAAAMVTRVMTTMLVGVTPTDPITFMAIVVLFVGIAVSASWLPARRASRLDPMNALREE